MKIITLLLLVISTACSASQIQIHALKEAGVLKSYEVWTWNGPDLKHVRTPYTIPEAQTKFGLILDRSEAGTSVVPDRVILDYDPASGGIYSAVFQVTEGKFENSTKFNLALSSQARLDTSTAKTDVETKTGKDLDGGDIKPPKEPPVKEIEVIP